MADEEKGMPEGGTETPATEAEKQPNQVADPLVDAPDEAFFGSYDHAIDGKGRIIIPSEYRQKLGGKFTIGPTRDQKAIALYPQKSWTAVLQELSALKRLHGGKPKVQAYLNRFYKYSYPDAEGDSQGRLLLPAKLRQVMLGDVRDVEISGALDHIRVVTSTKAAEDETYYKENEDEILEYIGTLDV